MSDEKTQNQLSGAERRREDYKAVFLGTPEGRRVLGDLIGRFNNPMMLDQYNGDPVGAVARDYERVVVVDILNTIHNAGGDLNLLKLIRESQNVYRDDDGSTGIHQPAGGQRHTAAALRPRQ